jgi:REP-associated tyrosine transposase
MPSPPRDIRRGIHHVWVNATGNWAYFLDDVDRVSWVRLLVQIVDHMGWTCVAFCQMSSHVHLLVSVPDESLPIGMRELNREYSCGFNLRHGRQGTFVRKRFGSRRIVDGADLLGVYSYVVRNPVVEHLCLWPEEWRWSSYRTTLGISADFPFVDAGCVLAEAGGGSGALRRAVEGALTRQSRPRPEPGSRRGSRS